MEGHSHEADWVGYLEVLCLVLVYRSRSPFSTFIGGVKQIKNYYYIFT